jgi:predicted RNA-binding protein with RPS1 domain
MTSSAEPPHDSGAAGPEAAPAMPPGGVAPATPKTIAPAAITAAGVDASTSAAAPEAGQSPSRRIPIGTQRPGVKPPRVAPKYDYFSSASSGSAGEAAARALRGDAAAAPSTAPGPQPPRAEQAAAPVVGSTHSAEGVPSAAGGAAELPFPAAPPLPQRPELGDAVPPPRRGDKREKRGATGSPFVDPRAKSTVALPNLRAGLDDDLEADFAAATAGLPIDDLLTSSAPPRAEAPLEPGARVQGTVLSIGPDTAFIDLGERRQGALKLAGLDDVPEVGAMLELSVGGRNDDDGLYEVAPANRAVNVEDWSQLEAGMIVAARVTAANKGGLECEVAGLRGFMPASLVSTWRIENLEELVGQTLESLVTEIVPAARRLVLSRRAVIEKAAAEARTKLLETLEVGATLEGTVRSVREFGAFVDIGSGVEGLVHVSQLSWDRVANPADVLQAGQRIRVVVKKIDHQTGKIGLSARDLVESPWRRAAEKYHVGATVRGTVSRIAQFGAFVKLEPGVEGLVHVSEIATRHIRSVGDAVKEGQTVECRVLAVDPDEQRMSLSIKALAAVPAAAADGPEADEPEAAAAEPPAAAPKKRSQPLKGGLGGPSAGEKFGLKW